MKKPLPKQWFDALRTGIAPEGRSYGSRKFLALAIATSMVNHGWTEDQWTEAMMEPFNAAGQTYRDDDRRCAKRLSADWGTAVSYVENNPTWNGREGVQEHLSEVLTAVRTHAWQGRTGKTDRLVMLALVRLAQSRNTWTPAFGVRAIAEESGLSSRTVDKALKRLVQGHHLVRLTGGTAQKASRYRFTGMKRRKRRFQSNTYESLPRGSYVVLSALQSHDIFMAGALGKSGFLVLSGLEPDTDYTVKEMSELLRMSGAACRMAAKRLVSCGLATESKGRPAKYRTVELPIGHEADHLDKVLSETPEWSKVLGTSERRRAQHQREREEQHQWRKENPYQEPTGFSPEDVAEFWRHRNVAGEPVWDPFSNEWQQPVQPSPPDWVPFTEVTD